MPRPQIGGFLAGVHAPLPIGSISLVNGAAVRGFLCEPAGLDGAEEITRFGGWRDYVAEHER